MCSCVGLQRRSMSRQDKSAFRKVGSLFLEREKLVSLALNVDSNSADS